VLEELLSKLKPAQTTVIRLVKIKGFSIEEAAEMTGQSESLVKVNIHRGLAKLASIVEAVR
jgi:DNA-directed RNA polymerase specialized sigma24 family protein